MVARHGNQHEHASNLLCGRRGPDNPSGNRDSILLPEGHAERCCPFQKNPALANLLAPGRFTPPKAHAAEWNSSDFPVRPKTISAHRLKTFYQPFYEN